MNSRTEVRHVALVAVVVVLTALLLAVPAGRAAAAGPTIVIASGNHQSVVVGKTFGQMKVQVLGDSGPQADTLLTFAVAGDATFAGGYTKNTIYTDSLGYAAPSAVHAGTEPGPVTVEVRFADGQVGAVFSATVLPDPSQAVALRVVSGDAQSIQHGAEFSDLVVVAERGGVPVPDVDVSFTIDDTDRTGSTFAGSPAVSTITGPDGRARARVSAGGAPGTFTVTVESALGGSTFTGQITTADAARRLEAVEGDDQTTEISTPFPVRLVFRLTDHLGHPVVGQRVDFTVGTDRASFEGGAISAYSFTGGDGTALVPVLYAGGTPGDTSVIATADGVSGPSRIAGLHIVAGRAS